MTRQSLHLTLRLALVGALAAACTDFLAPSAQVQIPESDLKVLEVADDAPPLTHTDVFFYAVRGRETRVEMKYETESDYVGNGKCLLLIVPSNAVLKRPDGSPVAHGDSVRIDIRIMNTGAFLFEFNPSGIRFGDDTPARLEFRYRWADFNGDGKADEADTGSLGLYRQERAGDSWTRVPSTQDPAKQEIHARITGFTRYALASD